MQFAILLLQPVQVSKEEKKEGCLSESAFLNSFFLLGVKHTATKLMRTGDWQSPGV